MGIEYRSLPATAAATNGDLEQKLFDELTIGRTDDESVFDHYGHLGLANLVNGEIQPVTNDYAFTLALTTISNLSDAKQSTSTYLPIPVTPEDFSMGNSRSYQSFDLLNAKQTVQLGQVALRTVSMSSFFPAVWDPQYCVIDKLTHSPTAARDWLTESMNSRTPLYLHVIPAAGAPLILSEPFECFVSTFTPSLKAGNPLDIFFDLDLVEHRAPTVSRVDASTVSTGHGTKTRHLNTRQGETLAMFAKRAYKDWAGGWRAIVKANAVKHTSSDGKVFRGIELATPVAMPNGSKRYAASRPSDVLKGGQRLKIPPHKVN